MEHIQLITVLANWTKKLICLLSTVFLFACGAGGESASDLPIILDAPIAYVKRPVQYDVNDVLIPLQIGNPINFNPGGDLYIRDAAASSSEERNVTSSFTEGLGDVKDVEFSFDGSTVLFAMRAADLPDTLPEDQPKWDIWEYNIASDTLTRIIGSDIIAQQHQDVSPHYLPDGQIIFASTRQQGNQATLTDELKPQVYPGVTDNRVQQALVLHRINPANGNITQISYNQSHDFNPVVLDSGRVLFSRWDNVANRNLVNLYSVNPDGTELQIVYGAHSHLTGSNNSAIQFLKVRELNNGEVTSLLVPFNGQTPGGLLTSIDINNFIDNTTPTWINTGLSTTAQSNLTTTNILTDGSISPGGLYNGAYPFRDGSSKYLASWTSCRLVDINDNIIPCSAENLADITNVAASPLFGLFVFDAATQTQRFVATPIEDIMFTDMAAASPRTPPTYIPDKTAGTNPGDLTQSYIDENVGVLNIKSVYDMDNNDITLGTLGGIAQVANPAVTTPDERPARFLRIVKAVSIPDRTIRDLDIEVFGVSAAQGMREIIGYAPIEPDGSVKIKVPANVPLAISVLDKQGKRLGTELGARHQNWIQVQQGETLTCNGCHNHANGQPHARPDGPPAINTGAPNNGYYLNTDPNLAADVGETMAEARTRYDPTALNPTVDIFYDDVWTDDDPMGANLTKAASFSYLYTDVNTPSKPTSAACQTTWQTIDFPVCRTTINYESHIHPLWSADRAGDTCINCHGAGGNAPVLSDGLAATQRENAYENLLAAGTPMSVAGAAASSTFFNSFETGTHMGRLTPGELKLLAEWLDIGAQYFNNPFDPATDRFVN